MAKRGSSVAVCPSDQGGHIVIDIEKVSTMETTVRVVDKVIHHTFSLLEFFGPILPIVSQYYRWLTTVIVIQSVGSLLFHLVDRVKVKNFDRRGDFCDFTPFHFHLTIH